MRIQPRQQLLEVWRAVARTCYPGDSWQWGGRDQRNSISDAEQILCLMGPATQITTFKVDLPDETAEDVLDAVAALGDSVEIPQLLIQVLTQYFQAYTDESGAPVFSGGSYFSAGAQEPTPEQLTLNVVDSYSVSIRLALASIGFVRVFRNVVRRDALRRAVEELESLASQRLTAAMLGLLRSFAVNTFDVSSEYGQNLCRMVNQRQLTMRQVVDDLQRELREIKAGLRDLTVGIGQVTDLDNENKLFECGWSWGIIAGAPRIEVGAQQVPQPDGVAEPLPYLYFTVVALDCIQDLFSDRTRILGLLDDEQQTLARALQIRWDLTQSYWSRIARFGRGTWPLESMPWRTTDGFESDYLTLLIASIMINDLASRRASTSDLQRVAELLRELGARARITRRPLPRDPAVSLHQPGFELVLEGSEALGGQRLTWYLADFAPQLLKQTLRVAGLLRDIPTRGRTIALADQIWEGHLLRRRMAGGPAAQLWDQPSQIYEDLKPGGDQPSWYYTERVVSCLVAAADLVAGPPLPSPVLADLAGDLLAEADHLFDQELLSVSAEAGPSMGTALQTVRATLRRAHETRSELPGTAAVLAMDVLRDLRRLASARLDASGTA
ncbi:MAG: hypothetical protein J2P15_04885 [Micromonosporaceae bacterium]|nr:hypothetical protein [Micromonosporaceae bacterium]